MPGIRLISASLISLLLAIPAAGQGSVYGELVNLVIDYPSISPNGDGVRDSSPVKIKLLQQCDTIAVTVEDTLGPQVLDTLMLLLAPPPGDYMTEWKGEDSLGGVLEEGSYSLRILASSGNQRELYNRTVIVDITPPRIQLDRIEPGIYVPWVQGMPDKVLIYFLINGYQEGTEISITTTDPNGVIDEPALPEGISGDGLYHLEWSNDTTAVDGTYTVSLFIMDSAGNSGGDEGFIDVDIAGPIQALIDPLEGDFREVPPLQEGYCFDRNGVDSLRLIWNDSDPFPPGGTSWHEDTLYWEFDIIDSVTTGGIYIEGDYELRALAYDVFGHSSEAAMEFTIDLTPPEAPVLVQPYSPVSKPDILLEVSYDMTDTDSFIVYRFLEGDTNITVKRRSLTINLTLEKGENQIWVRAVDRVGNVSEASNTITVVYETEIGFFYPEAFRGPDIFRIQAASEANGVEIDIFTLNGERVVTLKGRGPATVFQIEWDLTNDDGEEVRNGPYLLVITVFYSGSKTTDKSFIAVVR